MNRGSNPRRGAKFPNRVPTRRFPFLFCSFAGSNGARFRTVRTGSSATPVLPSRLFDNQLKQSALLGGGLLEEQLAGPARQAEHVNGLIDWSQRGHLDILDFAHQAILLAAPDARMLVEKLLREAPVELVQLHRPYPRLDLVVPGLQLLDGLRTGCLLGPVGREHSVAEPLEDRLRNDQPP